MRLVSSVRPVSDACRLFAFATACVLLSLLTGWSNAASLRISPIGVEMPATQRAASITLVNTSNEPVNLQLRVFKWSQEEGQDVLEPTTDIMVSPPAASLPPGASYTVRVARQAALPVDEELSYRLFIDELPKPVDPRTVDPGISMVLRTSMPVFVVDQQAIAQLSWNVWRDAAGLHAEATNHGKRHAKITQLAIQAETGTPLSFGPGLNGYVLAGSSRRFDLDSRDARALKINAPVQLTGRNGSLPIEEALHVETR